MNGPRPAAAGGVTLPKTALSAIWDVDDRLELREVPVSPPAAREVLVRVRAVGICGSDLHGFQPQVVRRHRSGVGPGHELAGEVVARGPGVVGPPVGTRVVVFPGRTCGECRMCLGGRAQLCTRLRIAGQNYPGGMGEYFLAQDDGVFALPPSLGWSVGALAEPCTVALHGLDRAHGVQGRRVLVVGGGTIGLLTALAALDAGAVRVAVAARHPHQAEAAVRLGVHEIVDPADLRPGTAVARSRWDLVVESVGGTHATLQPSIDVVARGGTVLLLGVHRLAQSISTARILAHELSIVGSMCCKPVGLRSDFTRALALISRHESRVATLITHTFDLDRVQEAFAAACDKSTGAIKVVVHPG